MPSNTHRVTMREIAQKFGISHATVSLALRNHPRISLQLRQRIQTKAAEMGYFPDPMLTVLAHYRHNRNRSQIQAAIAWINCWPDPSELRSFREFDAYWNGASECANKLGYHLEEFVVNKEMPLRRLERILITRNVKGILIPPHRAGHGLENLNFDHFSAVRLGRTVAQPALHIVTSDQAANALLAFHKIRDKGYERIGYIGFDSQPRLFTSGFLQAQLALPVTSRLPLLLFPSNQPLAAFRKELMAWLKSAKPEAILTEFGELPDLLAKIGYNVPGDVALAGLSLVDGNISAGIDQHSHEVGRVAMLTVISLINDFALGIPPIFRQILVEGRWVDGNECPDLHKNHGLRTPIAR